MELSYEEKCSLRDLGWTLTAIQGASPNTVTTGNVLRVGEDVRFTDGSTEELVVDLDSLV